MADDSQWQPPPMPEDDDEDAKTIPWASPLDAQVPTEEPQAPATSPSGSSAGGPPGPPPSAPPPPPPGAPPGALPPGASPSAPGAPPPGAFPPSAPGAPAPFGPPPGAAPPAPPPGAPGPQGATPPKSKKGLIAAGCGGCLFIVLCLCCCSGYILYLEEGVSYADPGDELERYPIQPAQPISVATTWNGTGYADLRVYVDVGESASPGTTLSGNFGCSEYSDLRMQQRSETLSTLDEVPDGWIPLRGMFLYVRDGQTVTCQGTLSASPPPPSFELVITERQRPSDILSF